MTTDLTKLSSDQVLDLINAENGSALTFEHISFGIPSLLEEDPSERNTALTVSAAPNGGYSGEVEVKYNRLPLSGFEQYGAPVLIIPPEGTMDDIVQVFNTFYDANLTLLEDIKYDLQMPVIDYLGSDIVLEAANESLAFTGTITVNVKWESTELSETIAKGMLSGLEYPIPMGEKLTGTVELLPILPQSIYGHMSTTLDNILYIIGGTPSSSTHINVVRRFDLSNDVFLSNAAPLPRTISYGHIATINGAIYVYGGTTNGNNASDELYRYTPDDDTWEVIGNSGYGGRFRGGYCVLGDTFYIGHGVNGSVDIDRIASEILMYNTTSDTWSVMVSPKGGVRYPCLSAVNEDLYVFGGDNLSDNTRSLSVWKYNIINKVWSKEVDLPEARSMASSVSIGGRIYVFGGYVNGFTTNLLSYDPSIGQWDVIADLANYPRRYMSVTAYDDKIYVSGGAVALGANRSNTLFTIS